MLLEGKRQDSFLWVLSFKRIWRFSENPPVQVKYCHLADTKRSSLLFSFWPQYFSTDCHYFHICGHACYEVLRIVIRPWFIPGRCCGCAQTLWLIILLYIMCIICATLIWRYGFVKYHILDVMYIRSPSCRTHNWNIFGCTFHPFHL